MAARRRAAKGQPLTVTSIVPFHIDFDDDTNGIATLIELRDARINNDNVLAPFAGFLESQGEDHTHRIVVAELVPTTEFDPYFSGNPPSRDVVLPSGSGLGLRVVDQLDRVCRAAWLANVEQRTAHLSLLDEDLLERYGFGVADIDAAMECLSAKVMAAGWFPYTFEMHGFEVVAMPSEDELSEAASVTVDSNGRRLTSDSILAALRYLDCGVHPIPLEQPLLQLPLRRIGEFVLFDGLHVQTSPAILWEADPSQSVRQRIEKRFETLVHGRLGEHGAQPWASGKKIKRPDGSILTDVDASVQIDELLVVADCYGSPWRASLDAGTHAQTRERVERLADKVSKWQEQWAEIPANHSDVLPAGVAEVLPVVVTAGAEWIASANGNLWLDAKTPVACTTDELIGHITARAGAPAGN